MKNIYFLPPLEPNKVWSRATEGEGNFVSFDGGKTEILITKEGKEVIKKAIDILYCKYYPKLCSPMEWVNNELWNLENKI